MFGIRIRYTYFCFSTCWVANGDRSTSKILFPIRPQSGSRHPPGWQCVYHARGQDEPCPACLARYVEEKDFSSRQIKWSLIKSRGPAQHEHQKPPRKRTNIVSSFPSPCCTLFRTRRYVLLRMQSEPTSFRAARGAQRLRMQKCKKRRRVLHQESEPLQTLASCSGHWLRRS